MITPETSTAVAQAAEKIIAVFGGKTIKVTFEDGRVEEVKVKQIAVREYEGAFKVVDDEFALTAFACGQPKDWAMALTPESYEALQEATREVNAKGFFAWHSRKEQATRDQIARITQIPDVAKMMMERMTSEVGSLRQPLRPAPTRPAR